MNKVKRKIPYGYCHCGCGQKTNLEPQTSKSRGWVKGKPIKFIHNHHCIGSNNSGWKNGIIKKGLYVMIRVKGKYQYEHRLIAEKVLGKPLPPGAEVHHYNGHNQSNKYDLIICENRSYHRLLDARGIALMECGHADWRKCKYCHQYDGPAKLRINEKGRSAYHNTCNTKYTAERRLIKNLKRKKKRVY